MPRVLRLVSVAVFVALLALPWLLRPAPAALPARTLLVITPHGEQIRYEFARAFAAAWQHEHGEVVGIDWRTPGGTSDIIRYLDGRYAAAIAERFPELSPSQRRELLRSAPAATTPEAIAVHAAQRAAYLESSVSCGIDVFFGGGEFSYRQSAGKGYLVDAGLRTAHPAWFADAVIPQRLSGETLYDAEGRYYGACLAVFGMARSPARCARLGSGELPESWAALAEQRFLGEVVFADPSRSAAVATCLERIVQQAMAEACADPDRASADELEAGWRAGFARIVRLAGNSRFITDGANKTAHEVARGEAAAGLAIDFHARAEVAWSAAAAGQARLDFHAPRGGTSVSADPIGLLRGAPHPDLARAFIAFVLSPEGQRLWHYRVGTPGGPERYELYRMPIRSDVLTVADRPHQTDQHLDPAALAASFTYRPAWTASRYAVIGPLTKAIALDAREELVAAWTAICRAGGPQQVPEAMAELTRIPLSFAAAPTALESRDAATRLARLRSWTEDALVRYARAERLAMAALAAQRKAP